MNNPQLTLTNDQWHALNRAVACAETAVEMFGMEHHRKTVKEARDILNTCHVPDLKITIQSLMGDLAPA